MKIALAIGLLSMIPNLVDGEPQSLEIEAEKDRISVFVDGNLFTAYVTEQFGQGHKYPFLHPVRGPGTGKTLTTFDQEPYPHHSSIFLSLDDVKSVGITGNFWHPRNKLKTGRAHSQNPRVVQNTGKKIVLRDNVVWKVKGHDPQLRDTRTITITAPSPEIRVLDFVFEFEALQDLKVGPTGHGMFSIRVHPDISGNSGGTILNAEGDRGEENTRAKDADWVAYFNERNGASEGLAIVQHPKNPYYPAKWFTRNYGFFSPNPIWKQQRRWKKGDIFSQRFRVIVFGGTPEEAKVKHRAKQFMEK